MLEHDKQDKIDKKKPIPLWAVVVLIVVIIVTIVVVIWVSCSNFNKQSQYSVCRECICQRQPSLDFFKDQNRISVNPFCFSVLMTVRRTDIVREFKSKTIPPVCYFYCFFLACFLPVWHLDLIKSFQLNQTNMEVRFLIPQSSNNITKFFIAVLKLQAITKNPFFGSYIKVNILFLNFAHRYLDSPKNILNEKWMTTRHW